MFSSFEEGKALPAWAAPAVRAVSGIMNQRGLGASSMAGQALVQAAMESALPIAQNDSQIFAKFQQYIYCFWLFFCKCSKTNV